VLNVLAETNNLLLLLLLLLHICLCVGTAVAQWLRYCATNQKVAGSIPDGVMEFFIDINPSDRTMTLGSTQLLTEMSTGNISWGLKAAGA
jgi:Na+/glutamate symporter